MKKFSKKSFNNIKKYKADTDKNCINSSFYFLTGNLPILLSAPHAVPHMEEGTICPSEIATGKIVEQLCRDTGCHGIIRCRNLGDDPNSDLEGEGMRYKEAAAEYCKRYDIKYAIDIHGCNDSHGWDVEIGTGKDNRNLLGEEYILPILEENLKVLGKICRNKLFCANGCGTVSYYLSQKAGTPCVQLEIAVKLRNEEKKKKALVEALRKVIEKLAL